MTKRAWPLDDRLAALTLLRSATGALALGVALATDQRAGVVRAVAAYGGVIVLTDLLRRVHRPLAMRAAPLAVALDGAFAIAVVVLSRGPFGPLALIPALVISLAALLSVSAASGAGVLQAAWCALALSAVHAASEVGGVDVGTAMSDREVAAAAGSYVAFGVLITAASELGAVGLRRRGARLAALVELDAEFARADANDDVLGALLSHARTVLGFRRAAAVIRAAEGWHGVVNGGTQPARVVSGGAIDAEAAEVLASGESVLVRELAPGRVADLLPDATNVVVAAVAADDEGFGVVAGEWGARRIPGGTVQALADAATHAALTLRHRALVEQIEQLATRDAVTGLPNRRLLEETLTLERGRALRERTPLSVVVLDVDHFKHVNDTRGHPAGDEVLRQVGAALASRTKAFDLTARYGGDEFVVVLPGCSREHVLAVAERLRATVAEGVRAAPVTVSAGVATLPDDAGDVDRLLVAADGALYEAKRLGRDRSARPPEQITRGA